MKKIPQNIIKQMTNYPYFYVKVWETCFNIPPGKTLSYKQVAELIGSPKSARAVALALSKNPFAPIIPCHRVIKSDGKIGGYSARGGVNKKIRMLNYEKETGRNASKYL
jgi:O-6-methylguanine DNA methyltransferase